MRVALAIALAAAGVAPQTGQCDKRPPGHGVDRYVSPAGSDSNDGSRSRPWRTIGYAAGQVRPGFTVHVAPGRYRGPLTLARGGTAEAPVRFVSDRRWRARISAESAESIAIVEIVGDHVAFEGFELRGSGGDGSAGLDLEGDDDAALGNRVSELRAPCLESGNGAAGILVGGGSGEYRNRGGLVDGNLVERVGSGSRDGSCRLAHGIYAAVPGVTIVNNIVTQAAGDGITSWHAARDLTVANNLAAANGGAGILIGSGDAAAAPTGHTGTLVANNLAYRNALYGITESSDGDHPVGPGNRFLNNLTFGNSGDTDDDSGVAGLNPGEIAEGNVNADPLLVGSGSAPRRYRLRRTSPAIDAGTSAGAPRHDFDEARRPRGRGFDIGPFERRR